MVTILGFDPSKSTGWAVFDPAQEKRDRNFSHIQCGVFEMPDKADEYYTPDQIGLQTRYLIERLIKEGRKPNFAVLERQINANIKGTNFSGSIFPWLASAAIVATLSNFGIPYGTVMPATWRTAYFGAGFQPPQKALKNKDGSPKLDKKGRPKFEDLWKDAAIARCTRDGIRLPKTKALADDAAEACALAICWGIKTGMKLHAGRYHEPWQALQERRNERPPAPPRDLFQEDAA